MLEDPLGKKTDSSFFLQIIYILHKSIGTIFILRRERELFISYFAMSKYFSKNILAFGTASVSIEEAAVSQKVSFISLH